MAEIKLTVPSTYVGPSCNETADAPHIFRISFSKRTGEVEVYAKEGRRSRGIITESHDLTRGEPKPGARRVSIPTGAKRATAKVLTQGAMSVLQALRDNGWIAELPSSAEVAAAIQ